MTAAERLKKEVGEFAFREWYRWRYLASQHWTSLRAKKLAANPVCEICRQCDAKQVHHLRYRAIYDVKITDLQSVCVPCHKKAHGLPAPEAVIPAMSYYEYRQEAEEREASEDARKKQDKRRARKKKGMPTDRQSSKKYNALLDKIAPYRPTISY